MAELLTVTSPLLVRYPDGEHRLVSETFKHPLGVIYAEPYWLESKSLAVYLLKGEIKGQGPWKIGEVIVRLLSCADVDYKMQWAEWQQYLYSCSEENHYFNDNLKQSIISKMIFSE